MHASFTIWRIRLPILFDFIRRRPRCIYASRNIWSNILKASFIYICSFSNHHHRWRWHRQRHRRGCSLLVYRLFGVYCVRWLSDVAAACRFVWKYQLKYAWTFHVYAAAVAATNAVAHMRAPRFVAFFHLFVFPIKCRDRCSTCASCHNCTANVRTSVLSFVDKNRQPTETSGGKESRATKKKENKWTIQTTKLGDYFNKAGIHSNHHHWHRAHNECVFIWWRQRWRGHNEMTSDWIAFGYAYGEWYARSMLPQHIECVRVTRTHTLIEWEG